MKNTTHAIIDCWSVSKSLCNNDKLISSILENAAINSGCEVIAKNRYRFGHNSPEGCTVVLMLDESHISAHTYANEGRMALDVFISASREKCESVVNSIIKNLRLDNNTITYIGRFRNENPKMAIQQSEEKYIPEIA